MSQTWRDAEAKTHLVSAQNDRDVLADPCQVSVPVGHVLVRDAAGHVEHDDRALPLDAALEMMKSNKMRGAGGGGSDSLSKGRWTKT